MVRKVGVLGAGEMGSGIAHVSALAGCDVHLTDVDRDAVDRAVKTIDANLSRQVARGSISAEKRAVALGRITADTEYAGFSDCDIVVEAITEDETVKRAAYARLCPLLKPTALIATNTSSISVTRLAAATDRPDRFVGLHFMNPVPLMNLVEIIRGIATAEGTIAIAREYVTRLGKRSVSAEDFPAFIVSRIMLSMINEAVYTLYEGVGTIEAIDVAMRLGANHPVGPLELADFIGLDTCLSQMHTLHAGLADNKYLPCPLLVKYVEAGWLGRKAGRGFYDYSGDKPVPTR